MEIGNIGLQPDRLPEIFHGQFTSVHGPVRHAGAVIGFGKIGFGLNGFLKGLNRLGIIFLGMVNPALLKLFQGGCRAFPGKTP